MKSMMHCARKSMERTLKNKAGGYNATSLTFRSSYTA